MDAKFAPFSLRLGKFDSEFSLASQYLDGRLATDLVGGIDTDERLGASLSFEFEALGLDHILSASAFTTDRTVFSRSLFTDRGQTRLSDGGAGNTDGVSSLSMMLDGCSGKATDECYSDGDFGYRLGARYQKAGHASEDQLAEGITPRDEWAYVAALTWRRDLGDEAVLRFLGELDFINHFETGPDDAILATIAAQYEWDAWKLDASYTLQTDLIKAAPNSHEHLIDLTVAFDFDEDMSLAGETWTVSAGYSYAKAAEEAAHLVGITISAELNGSMPLNQR